MIYAFFLITVLTSGILELAYYPHNKRITKQCYVIASLLFIGIGGLTKVNGLDFDAYLSIFNYSISFTDIGEFVQFEPFFLLLCSLFPSYEVFIFVFMIINLYLISKTIFRYSPYPCLSLFVYISIYYLLGPMGQLRQAIALSIMIYAWRFFSDKKFLLFILVASLFHYSALLCLVIYFIPNKLYEKKVYIIFIILAFVLFLPAQKLMINILTHFIGSIDSIIGAKLEIYMSREEAIISIPLLMYKLMITFLLLLKRKNLLAISSIFPKLLNMYIFSLSLYLFLSFSGTINGRLTLYFSLSEILLLPLLFEVLRKQQIRFIIYPLILLLCAYQYFSFLFDFSTVFIPYKPFFL